MDPIRTASVLVWLSTAALAVCTVRVTRRMASGVLTAMAGVFLAAWQAGLLGRALPAPTGAGNVGVLIPGTLLLVAHILLLSQRLAAGAKRDESVPPADDREVHRRIRNNLEIAVGLLGLEGDKVSDDATGVPLAHSQSRLRAMALIHEALAVAEQPDEVDFDEFLHRLYDLLCGVHGVDPRRVNLVTEIATPLPARAAMGCALIAHELLANALGHAFGQGADGEIRVCLARDGGGAAVLTVRDNGAGMPTDFNPADGRTVGLPWISALTQQLGARLEIEDQGGVACRILLPGSDAPS